MWRAFLIPSLFLVCHWHSTMKYSCGGLRGGCPRGTRIRRLPLYREEEYCRVGAGADAKRNATGEPRRESCPPGKVPVVWSTSVLSCTTGSRGWEAPTKNPRLKALMYVKSASGARAWLASCTQRTLVSVEIEKRRWSCFGTFATAPSSCGDGSFQAAAAANVAKPPVCKSSHVLTDCSHAR